MATFTFTPDFDAAESSEPRIRKVQFADGSYEHRIKFGLNTNPKTYDLTFANRTDTEADQIEAFFDAMGGSEAFDWNSSIAARRNLLTYSEDLAFTSVWTRFNLTALSPGLIGFAGGTNAFGLVANATNDAHYIQQTVTVAASTNTTTSVYVKKGLGRDAQMIVYGASNYHGVVLNQSTNVATLTTFGSVTTTDWGATAVNSDWWRLWITGRPDNGTTRTPKFLSTNAAGASSFIGDASSTYLQLMAPQMEYGSLSSYQPVYAAEATKKWVCERWNRRYLNCNNNTVTATFRQVYEA